MWGGREREGGGGENVGGEGAIIGIGGSGGAREGLIGTMGFAAAETELAVEESARTIGFEMPPMLRRRSRREERCRCREAMARKVRKDPAQTNGLRSKKESSRWSGVFS